MLKKTLTKFYFFQLIRKNTNNAELHAIGTYYFDGQGKAFRPMVITLMARALNTHMNKETK